jgi:hypothetical protein
MPTTDTHARFTLATSFVVISVLITIRMALRAVSLPKLFVIRTVIAPAHVFIMGHWLKVHRIYTSRETTAMIDLGSWWNRAYVMFIGDTMRLQYLSIQAKGTVSVTVAQPFPAAIRPLLDFGHETTIL